MNDFTPRGYLAYIETPGRGWGFGCHVERVRDTEVAGVAFVCGTAVDNRSGERTSIYVTEDGYVITPCTGSGIRWAVDSHHDGIIRWQRLRCRVVGTGVTFTSNLTRAADVIREARETTPNATPHPLKGQP